MKTFPIRHKIPGLVCLATIVVLLTVLAAWQPLPAAASCSVPLFTEAPGSPFEVGSDPQYGAVGDYNGDGALDLAVVNEGIVADGTVSVLLNLCRDLICRTAGFWQTHAGTECPKNKPNCGSQNITQPVIEACGECIEICGEIVQNTAFNDADSAVEAMCIPVKGDIRVQLARQLTAASLNCCLSGAGSDCAGSPAWEFIFSACNLACENQTTETEGYQLCIDALDCLNKGGNLVEIAPVICQPPLVDSCAFQALCNDTLGLCFNSKQEKIAGSANACNKAIKSACGVIPIDESKGEFACGSGTKEDDPEGCCGNGEVSGSEECDEGQANGTDESCCTEDCQFKAQDAECRPAAGYCDEPEFCSGTSGACPPDEFDSGSLCRDMFGDCDVAEYCDGSGPDCPFDGFDTGKECRSTNGDCDEAEYCDGSSPDCPPDGFNTGFECRGVFGVCDVSEYCDGTGPNCPFDVFDTGTECRPAFGDCDAPEYCDGTSPDCPFDEPAPPNCGDTFCCPEAFEDDLNCPQDCGCAVIGCSQSGGQAPSGCYCDCVCFGGGDCCADVENACGIGPSFCGNGTCGECEDEFNCSQDCGDET